ncbi:hypothetical protein PS683_00258 [Pseudomonas fluorescens]|uniref:Uncharacterized protein n=1 Tax=Pseudomonas fluorescens TaxID=294 RepID=A0A5E6MH57_PSEFL|nr:hypothetical protein PS683_00258 [Pseudomonas fluorescens]VVM40449.1 hypothetical protein PS683_00258 [Pseudomonas fluorescens]
MEGAWRRPPKSLSDYGHTERERGAECWGKSPLVTLGLFSKVTRCKSGTNISRNLNNGYVPGLIQHPGRLSGRLRGQARSHIFRSWGVRKRVVGWQAVFAGKPAPTVGSRGDRQIVVGCQGAFAGKPAPTVGSRGDRQRVVGCQAAFAGKPAPTVGSRGDRQIVVGCQGAFASKPAPRVGSRGDS